MPKEADFSAFKCQIWRAQAIIFRIVMQSSHLFLHRTIDFCIAPIYVERV
jgi:hypothetical protein